MAVSDAGQPGPVRMILTTGLPFGLVMGLVLGWLYGPFRGAVLGLGGGVAFGLLLWQFMRKAAARSKGPPPADGEALRSGPANHWVGRESVGGMLHLTASSLYFESHGMNVRDHTLRIAIADITGVQAVRTLGIVPNGLRVHVRQGGREQFVVSGRGAWVAAIEAARRG